jgi:hypothetical protein
MDQALDVKLRAPVGVLPDGKKFCRLLPVVQLFATTC